MRYTVGPSTYKVRISPEPLKTYDGQPAWGLCHPCQNLIEIGPDCPPGERFPVLLHELRHAWCQAFPRPADDEGDADHYAAMTLAIFK
ncbi:MAG: DUF6782 family putative metallopeptidase [Planctomycetota bacterium]